ncbi:hypothetical protein [Acidithiobacillus sp.]|uniref:hypothetical protein n=1 Tax=Acidithiobacillus sp. TaxID=1872118 RepID=UPI0025C46069|nr:hypothetical protein [Acidithiobacillus sp.]
MSAIHLLSRLSRCRSSHNQNPPDLTEVLAAVSERQWVLERQWQSIIQSLPEASPAEITSRLLALDEERVRYRRFWTLWRANLRAARGEQAAQADYGDTPTQHARDDGSAVSDCLDSRPSAR